MELSKPLDASDVTAEDAKSEVVRLRTQLRSLMIESVCWARSDMGWYQDTGQGTPVLADNVGFASRNLLHRNSQLITLYMPLKHVFGYCQDVDKITKNVLITVC